MAIVTEKFFEGENGLMFVEYTYDDVTGRISSAHIVNDAASGRVLLVQLSRNSGAKFIDVTFPPGTDVVQPIGGNRNLFDQFTANYGTAPVT